MSAKDMRNAIKTRLEECRMTQKELAEKMGSNESSVSKWISGERIPRLDNFFALAEALGVESSELIEVYLK